MSDYNTRLALWSAQGMRRCKTCGGKVYRATDPGGSEFLEHVDTERKSSTRHQARRL
jgi:hypothetical protein